MVKFLLFSNMSFPELFMIFFFFSLKLPGLNYLLRDPGDKQALRALLKMWMQAKKRQVLSVLLLRTTKSDNRPPKYFV